MRGGWIGILLGCLLANSLMLSAAQARETTPSAEFRVASEAWENHSNADGSGLAWDLLRAVFEPVGVKLKITSVPYTRALGLAQRGKVDAVLGLYLNEAEGIAYPRWPYADDAVVALGLARAPAPTLQSLAKYRLIWVRGYAYQSQIPNLTNYQEVQRRDGIPQMLKQGRADFYIDDDDEVKILLAATEHPQEFKVTPLQYLPVYLGFAHTVHGRAMQALYEQRMPQLLRAGTLRPIFARYQQHYPYDSAQEMPHARP
ncbi:MAG: transporter substrate-binding domain-containing protein [Pseudomonas sp.]|uniref:substrate-binding periplasmic protein n=1 Tax=Pseudomonas sp. TaxID=306 RepID=UPI0027322EB6|nr:transporter substrate-binding domain-containing protein [Pseudomonas sp.]MDP3845200.1 transporter substrate-binding domain-containing protein [Pseudomonas sp.]